MQTDLFPTDRHDAGGRVKSALPSGLKGDAVFYGERDEYRPLLRRWIGNDFPGRYVLFVGMNPSVAEVQIQDPTITREWGFTSRWGYDGYVKCNVADYRATFPKDLLVPGIIPTSTVNLPTILYQALAADLVVICHGNLNQALEPLGREVIGTLRLAGIKLHIFGMTMRGFPKHPLYLKRDSKIVEWQYEC